MDRAEIRLTLICAVALSLVIVLSFLLHRPPAEPSGPAGVTSTVVELPTGDWVQCVVARDELPGRSVALSVDCDWDRVGEREQWLSR